MKSTVLRLLGRRHDERIENVLQSVAGSGKGDEASRGALLRARGLGDAAAAIADDEFKSPKVVRSPVTAIGDGHFVRTVDVARTIGTSSLRKGGGPTSVLTVYTDSAGNLITTFPL